MQIDDEHLAAAANRHLTNNPEGQLVELLLTWIAEDQPSWLSPALQQEIWPTEVRFEWLLTRPDVRGRVVSNLAGISMEAARRLDPDVQIALVDALVEAEDVSAAQWAAAFVPGELAAHAPPGAVHAEIRKRFPWDGAPTDDSRNFLFAWLEAVLSRGDGNGRSREPILSPLGFRSAIDSTSWQACIPTDVRASVDDARLAAEQLGRPFGAAQEMGLVDLTVIVEHLAHRHLQPVLKAVEEALGHELDAFEQEEASEPVEESEVQLSESEPQLVVEADEEMTMSEMHQTDQLTDEAPRA